MQPPCKKNMQPWQKYIMQPEWVRKITSPHKKSRNFSTHKISQQKNHATSPQKNHATSPQKNYTIYPQKKSCNLNQKKILQPKWVSGGLKKITQPLHKNNHTTSKKTSSHKKSLNLFTSSHTKNHATSSHIQNHKTSSPLHTKKSPNLFRQKITQALKNKYCKTRKTLPWEHHIGCKMCQIALFKST